MAAPNRIPVTSASISQGTKALSLTGNWTAILVPGDEFRNAAGRGQIIDAVGTYTSGTNSTAITLAQNWTEATISAAPGEIIKMSEGASLAGKVVTLINLLGNGVLQAISSLSGDGKILQWVNGTPTAQTPDGAGIVTKVGAQTLSDKTFSGATNIPGGVITADGKLGVGKANPTYGVDVNGSIGVGSIVANAGLGYNNPAFLLPSGDDQHWAYGMYGVGSEYYMQVTYADTGTNELRGFRVIDTTSSNTVFSTGFIKTYVRGNLGVGTSTVNSGAKLDVAGNIYPHNPNSYNLGAASFDFANGWIHNAWTVTSDETLKTNFRALLNSSAIADLPNGSAADAEVAAAGDLLKLICLYQWQDSVADKGADKARIHSGIPAQHAMAVMAKHGLDAGRYGWFCADPLTQLVRKTRTVSRQKTQAVTVTIGGGEYVEHDGSAVWAPATTTETRLEPVWTNERDLPAVDADGKPVMEEVGKDEKGNPVIRQKVIHFADPVMEDVQEEYFEAEPVLDKDGKQVLRHSIRYGDLHNWLIAALARRLSALETTAA